MKEKLTEWFPSAIDPVHVGPYEIDREDGDGRAACWWDGKRWHGICWEFLVGGRTFAEACARAQTYRAIPRAFSFKWRGLAEPYEGGKP